ncbi:MAG TPA: hypothetical protein VFQ93_13655 [Casimicrobiaceae bacterium]|nr:hypothetical protein [Casimicrobiaceae bacterium]
MSKHLKKGRSFGVFIVGVFGLLTCSYEVIAQDQQEHVHRMSHTVMPFDIAKTLHTFTMTESGGIERVTVRDKRYADQVAPIQQHLSKEAGRFQRGDYSDPAMLHGSAMPGLDELRLGAKQIKITYSDLPDGAEITFETTELHLITAIHRWFGAQLSEHGADAKAG